MVWPAIIGGLIGAGGSLLGGLMSSNSAQRGQDMQAEMAERNIALQREFAQNGIRWKAEDARQAGIHPAFAMGASTQSFSPVSINPVQDDSASHFARAGQDIGRAVTAGMTSSERTDQTFQKMARVLQMDRMNLENELLRSQISRSNAALNPPMPTYGQSSPGGGNTGDVILNKNLGVYETKPHEITTALPGNAATAAGPAGPQVKWNIGPNGALQPFPPKELGVEDEFGAPLMARWLITQSYQRPPEAVWKQAFPGATGVNWSTRALGWEPTYPDPNYRHPSTYRPTQGIRNGQYVRGPVVTVPMPRFQ
ncbi:MAG: DNA pilot protein [Microvirus sp.]|nr:MAG: DNA pilot protein [Microvirus sp.]